MRTRLPDSWSGESAYALQAKTDYQLHVSEPGEPVSGAGRLGGLPSGWSAGVGHTEPREEETVATNAGEPFTQSRAARARLPRGEAACAPPP